MNNFKLINETSSPENLVVFIHGFTGTDDTWEKKDGSMPFINTLLKQEPIIKETYNIRLFFYTSNFWGEDKSESSIIRGLSEGLRSFTNQQQQYNQPIHKIAGLLKSEIDMYMDEKDLQSINLTLIAHSMGGLVTKHFIIANSNERRYKFKSFHSIHVPHQGSELATIGNTLSSGQQKIDLKPNSEVIKALNDDWLKIPNKKLPYTYYYIGENDNTVLATSALGSEQGARKNSYEKITHTGGHSDFLENSENMVWRKIRTSLKKNQNLESLEKTEKSLSKEELKIENNVEQLYESADVIYPQCREFTCFRHNKQVLFEDIYSYVNAISDELNDNKEVFDAQIDYLFDSITAFLADDDPMTMEGRYFSYEGVYKYILEYINKNNLKNCSCNIKDKFKILMSSLEEAELAFC